MITTHIFIGCRLSPDLRIKLNQSLAWKQSRVAPEKGVDPLEVYHSQRHYLGFFLQEEKPTLGEVRSYPPLIRQAILRYCEEYPVERLKLYLFPQLFVS